MKITQVNATLFSNVTHERDSNWKSQNIQFENETLCLVELMSDSGLTGVGIASAWTRPHILSLARDTLIGEDPRAVTALWQKMENAISRKGERFFYRAQAALDQAIWDLKAKSQGVPLWKSLGGTQPRANAYASWKGGLQQDEIILDWFKEMSSKFGLRAGKLPVGGNLEADIRRLRMVRNALRKGDSKSGSDLMIDIAGRWRIDEAIRHIRQIESEFDITSVQHVEENDSFLAARKLAEGIRAGVCVGRELSSCRAFLPFFQHHAVNIVEINSQNLGISGALQLADAAYGFELPVILTAVAGNMHVHLAAVMPNFMSMEVTEPQVSRGVIVTNVGFESGRGIGGNEIGNGLTVNRKLLSESAIDMEGY